MLNVIGYRHNYQTNLIRCNGMEFVRIVEYSWLQIYFQMHFFLLTIMSSQIANFKDIQLFSVCPLPRSCCLATFTRETLTYFLVMYIKMVEVNLPTNIFFLIFQHEGMIIHSYEHLHTFSTRFV